MGLGWGIEPFGANGLGIDAFPSKAGEGGGG